MRYFARSNSNASNHSASSRRTGSIDATSGHGQQQPSRASPDGEYDANQSSLYHHGLATHPRAASAATSPISDLTSGPTSPRLNQDIISQSIPTRTSSREASNDSAVHGRSDSLAHQLLSRGRRLKSSSSKLSVASMASSIGSESTARSTTGAHSRNISRGSRSPSRSRSISNPSGFQHMAHMEPAQFIKMNDMSENDLVADFSAMRASQHQRRDFRGIKAIDLHSRNSSTETATASASPSERSSTQFSVTTSGTSSTRSSVQNIDPSMMSKTHIRKNLSQESFSQPFSNGRPPRPALSMPVNAPPRTSSKKATLRHDVAQSAQQDSRNPSLQDPGSPRSPTEKPSRQRPASETDTDAEPSSEDECKRSEPSSPAVASGAWPLPTYGQALSVVDEEEQTPSKLASGRLAPRPSRPVPRSTASRQISRKEPVSSSSSSEESNATITPASYVQNLGKSRTGSLETPPSSFARYQAEEERRISMKRSSMNQGLFSSWVEADDDSSEGEDEGSATPQNPPATTSKESAHAHAPPTSSSRGSSRKAENITASLSVERDSEGTSKSERSSRESTTISSRQRSSTASKTASASTSTKHPTSKPSPSSKHSRYASEPPSSASKDSKPSKKRVSAA